MASCLDGPWDFCACNANGSAAGMMYFFQQDMTGLLDHVLLIAPKAAGPYSLSIDGFCAGIGSGACDATGTSCPPDSKVHKWESLTGFGTMPGPHNIEIWRDDGGNVCTPGPGLIYITASYTVL